jgi:hypothetical protein
VLCSVKLEFIEAALQTDRVGQNIPANLDVVKQLLLNRRIAVNDAGVNRSIDAMLQQAPSAKRSELAAHAKNDETSATRQHSTNANVVEVHVLHPASVGEVTKRE